MMTLAAVLCCVMTLAVFAACDKDEHRYTISVLHTGPSMGADAVNWTKAVLNLYQSELGVASIEFTKDGEQEQCDKEVLEACKRAEQRLGTVGRGSGEITVTNITARKRIYGKIIQ